MVYSVNGETLYFCLSLCKYIRLAIGDHEETWWHMLEFALNEAVVNSLSSLIARVIIRKFDEYQLGIE